jgi:hypothetical protein
LSPGVVAVVMVFREQTVVEVEAVRAAYCNPPHLPWLQVLRLQ